MNDVMGRMMAEWRGCGRWRKLQADRRLRAVGTAGQSLVELVVGLLAVVLVLIGILQIGRLSMEHTQVLMDAREEADEIASADFFTPSEPGADYLWRVAEGPDERSYSVDDRRIPGEPGEIVDSVVAHAAPSALREWMPANALAAIENPATFMGAFDLMSGGSASERVELYPIIRRAVVDDDYIRLRRVVWMPWLRGLDQGYE